MEENLQDLKNWLLSCGYPNNIIEKGIHNAKLQGPANAPTDQPIMPFVSTYYSNYDNGHVLSTTKSLIENSKNKQIQEAFKDVKFINAYRQPPNLLRQITNAEFITNVRKETRGITLCGRSNCKICDLYLQECDSFQTANGSTWEIRCHITCNSKNVIYYQVCNFCSRESNTGKTDNLRERTNNHISCCRHGTGSDLFDLHVYQCARKNIPSMTKKKTNKEPVLQAISEPFFKLYVFMELSNYNALRNHERRLHLQGHDTINTSNSSHNQRI